MYAYCDNNPIVRTDGSGEVWHYAIIAAAIEGSLQLAGQLLDNGGNLSKVNWSEVGWAAVPGGAGALKGAVIGGAIGAATGAAVSAVKHRSKTGSWKGAGKAARNGAADGFMKGTIAGAASGVPRHIVLQNQLHHLFREVLRHEDSLKI